MDHNGFILLYRTLLKKPIWKLSTPQQRSVLIAILLLANHEENEWEWKGQKFKVQPGQFITSLDRLRKKSGRGISTQNVRSSLARFKKLEFLTDDPTKTGRLITILNWEEYQLPKNSTQQRDQQRPNKGPTPNNNDNNETIIYLLKRYADEKLIQDTISALKTTRKTGKIADSIIIAELEYWANYPVPQVEAALRTYLDKDFAGEGKGEKYLRGIVRNQKQLTLNPGGKHGGFSERKYEGTDPSKIGWFGKD